MRCTPAKIYSRDSFYRENWIPIVKISKTLIPNQRGEFFEGVDILLLNQIKLDRKQLPCDNPNIS